MAELHQLLAVEGDARKSADDAIQVVQDLFLQQSGNFDGIQKLYEPYEENGEKLSPETKEVVTTIPEALKLLSACFNRGIDAQLSKEETNASGNVRAKLKLGEWDFGEWSATSLLALEQRLQVLKKTFGLIPTIDSAKKWKLDSNAARRIFLSEPEVRFRSQKRIQKIVKAEATKEHPAQVELVQLDTQVGRYDTTYLSGRISESEKRKMVDRLDKLIASVKEARAVANKAEVIDIHFGQQLFDYVTENVFK